MSSSMTALVSSCASTELRLSMTFSMSKAKAFTSTSPSAAPIFTREDAMRR